ncbi:CU044_5270 family protein [Streptosporangium sp. NPDC000396]|uniref:CU044_5270 family protein n=1 Tax=Streptosporangium sp. NPDC000396 TaxID=3366185 RepID=UPI0036A4EF97
MDDLTALRELFSVPPPSPEVIADGKARLAAAFTTQSDSPRTPRQTLPRSVQMAVVPPLQDSDDTTAKTARTRRAARTARWTALGMGLLGAAAAVTFVVASGVPAQGPRPAPLASSSHSPGQPVTKLSAKEILLAAADSVAKTPVDGAYWVRSGVSGHQRRDPSGRYTLQLATSVEIWVPQVPGKRTWVIRQDLGTKPATPQDEEAWRAAGSPQSWTIPGKSITEGGKSIRTPDVTLRAKPGEREAIRDDSGKTLTLLGTPMTPAALRGLPTTPEGLRDHLERLITKGYGAERVDMNAELYETGVQLIMRFPVSPEVRVAAYRMLASLPGVTAQGEVTDPLGRTGQAVSRQGGPNEQSRFVVDTATGQPLVFESTFTTEGEQHTTYEVIKKTGWTDEEPELPARRYSTDSLPGPTSG